MPHQIRFIFLLVYTFFCIASHAQDASLLHKTYQERYEAVDSIRFAIPKIPQSEQEKTINRLINWAEKNDDDELATHLKVVQYQLLDINDIDAVNKALKEIYKIEKNSQLPIAADCYMVLSEKASIAHMYSEAIEYHLKSYYLFKNMSAKEFPKRRDYQHLLATKYYTYKDYERTKQLLLEMKTADTGDLYDIIRGSYYNTLALAYTKLGQLDSAFHAFVTIYNRELHNNNYISAAIAAGNAGEVCDLMKDDDNAIVWLKREYEIANKYYPGHIDGNISNSHVLMATIYLRKHMPDMALNALQTAKNLMPDNASPNTLKQYYEVYARIMAAQNRINDAYIFLDSSRFFADSAGKEFDKSKLIEAEFKIDKINHDLELKELEHNRQTSVYIRNGAIIIIILLSVIALLFINRSRLRHIQKQETLQKEKEKAEIELNSAAIQLEQFTQNIHEKNQLIELFSREIDNLKIRENSEEKNELLLQLQQSTILTDKQWDDFRILFEKVHAGFLHMLKEKYTEITPAETRYIALVKLHMNNKEMAGVLGVTEGAIRNYKTRLRRKFGLNDEDNLEEMIKRM